MSDYDPMRDAAESYDAAIAAKRAQLLMAECPAAKRIEVIGGCTLYLGDCLDLMSAIPDGSVDLVLTDPPYGTTACKWDAVIPFEPMWAQVRRVLKPNGAAVFTASQPFTSALVMSNPKWFRHDWVWRKSRPAGQLNAKRAPLKDLEQIIVFCGAAPTYNPQGLEECLVAQIVTPGRAKGQVRGRVREGEYTQTATNYPRQVLDFASVHNVGALHPTQKPVALMEYLIRTYTNEGETVLDFTMGSGTTGVAARNTSRNFIGIERDPDYFDIAFRRIELAYSQAAKEGE